MRQVLGFSPLVGLVEGIKHSVDWYRDVYRTPSSPVGKDQPGRAGVPA